MTVQWMFFQPWWVPNGDVLVSRATPEDIESGSWLFSDDRATTASLDEIETWLSDRAGQIIRSLDRIEWVSACENRDFETYMRWR